MAREVYADPFGSYVRGYDTGTQREMALQRGVRDARETDYNFYNIKPLELNTALRNDEIGAAAQPYRLKLLPLGYQNAVASGMATQLDAYGRLLPYGIQQPTNEAIQRATGLGYVGSPVDGGRFIDQFGNPASRDLLPEDYLNADPGLRGEQYKRTQDEINNQVANQQLYNSAINSGYYGQQVQAQINAAAAKAAGVDPATINWSVAPGTPAGNVLWGGTAPAAPVPGGIAPVMPGQGTTPVQAGTVPPYPQNAPLSTPQGRLDYMYGLNPNAPRYTIDQIQQMTPEQKQQFLQTYWPGMAQQFQQSQSQPTPIQ
jgi:hypothetical protein